MNMRPTPNRASAKRASREKSAVGPAPANGAVADLVAEVFAALNAAVNGLAAVPDALLKKRKERAQQRLADALAERAGRGISKELAAEVQALAREWASRGFDDAFEKVERFEQRCFEQGEMIRARESGDRAAVFAAMETKHRAAVVREYGKIEIRGLQMSARVYQDLDVAYVPLWVQDDSQEAEVVEMGNGTEVRAFARLTVPEMLAKHQRVVMVGAPGSGKTTVVAYLAAQAADGRLHAMTGWEESPVPFVLPVRSLEGSRLDEDTIAVANHTGSEFVRWVLRNRRALLLVDGLDETREGAAALIPELKAFGASHPGSRILVTTRPAAMMGNERVEVAGFVTTTLAPMSRDDVYMFIEKWCEAAERSIQKDRVKATEDARRAAEDLKSRLQTSRPVERLAQTPLICNVLCIVHRFLGQRIPERRAALYETCTNVLLYEWDRAKFPVDAAIGQLDAQEKKLLLGALARWMHEAHVAEVPRDDLIRQFKHRLRWTGHRVDQAESIVREIQDRSGILVERRPGYFAFSHLTFQEYLTALEIVRAGDLHSLVNKYKDRWWHEVTVLAAGLPGADAADLIERLLQVDTARENISSATLLAAQCAETAVHLSESPRKEIERRLGPLVPPRADDDVARLSALGEVAAPVLLRRLRGARPAERARTALALGYIGSEAACGALVNMLTDGSAVEDRIVSRIGFSLTIEFDAWQPVCTFAVIGLFNLGLSSSLVQNALEQGLSTAHPNVPLLLERLHSLTSHFESGRRNLGEIGVEHLGRLVRLISSHQTTRSRKPATRAG